MSSSFNDESWLFNNNLVELKPSYNNETLQEPVPFEDFKFSFGMNPDLSPMMDPFLQEPFNFMPASNTVLDENDQKAFSSFLDTFFMDPDTQFQSTGENNFYEFESNSLQQKEDEEYRRSSILQSLDEQKLLHQRLNMIASLPTTTTTTTTTTGDQCRNESSSKSVTSEEDNIPQSIYLRQSDSVSSPYLHTKKRSSSSAQLYTRPTEKKARTNKELLTEEEKRANHIASEQKRRSTIRNGFKDLTDLIPTLKNINNSKSTVLFKAVDFIRYLEKRNKGLKEKVGSLQLRVQVESRMTSKPQMTAVHPPAPAQEKIEMMKRLSPPPPLPTSLSSSSSSSTLSLSLSVLPSLPLPQSTIVKTKPFMNNPSHLQGLPANARNALLAHKTQQKQLLLLQEQLQMHQRLIAQQQELKEKSIKNNKLPPILGKYDQSSLLKELEDNAISAP
ncbi:hypothetical protein INT47_008510 [Mucor saturninus]|uniref:BHLH domain-containing protein n=1 Tax=Mucor saturninus TaxID=64648 RepID=A0A8H7R9A6_9FUNG|nr:hypothetical protein INT47_008510 [Mucor saturninus]